MSRVPFQGRVPSLVENPRFIKEIAALHCVPVEMTQNSVIGHRSSDFQINYK